MFLWLYAMVITLLLWSIMVITIPIGRRDQTSCLCRKLNYGVCPECAVHGTAHSSTQVVYGPDLTLLDPAAHAL